jgi:GTP-binding protein Era
MSALNNFNVDRVQERILELLPESPPYFEKDALTDKPMRFFVTEIIREKALLIYQKEVPYAIEAVVEEYKEERDIIRIRATILVERESQKGIVIGYKGAALKKLGTLARKELERFLEKKVFLQLHVKVEKDWRNRDNMLKAFGYKLD